MVSILLRLIYRFSIIPLKIPADYFCRKWQLDSKIAEYNHGTPKE